MLGSLVTDVSFGRARSDYAFVNLGTPVTSNNRSHSQDDWQPYIGAGPTCPITRDIRLEADVDVSRVKATNSPANARSFVLGAAFAF